MKITVEDSFDIPDHIINLIVRRKLEELIDDWYIAPSESITPSAEGYLVLCHDGDPELERALDDPRMRVTRAAIEFLRVLTEEKALKE